MFSIILYHWSWPNIHLTYFTLWATLFTLLSRHSEMTLIDSQITPSTLKAYYEQFLYSLNIWLCWCVFNEISGYSASHLHWKNMESFWCWVPNYRHITFMEQDFDLLFEKSIVGGQVSRRYESSVSSYILFYPATVSRMCKGRSTLLFHLFPVQLHLLVKCLCLCVSSFLSLWSVKEYMKKKKVGGESERTWKREEEDHSI